jgi:RNA-directed DNA polymerase
MNVEISTCASSAAKVQWHSINWIHCHRTVKKLQIRIVKATQDGRWNKVKSLQWLLTHSFSGKAIAVKRVTENQGKKTSGVDNVTWSTPNAKAQAIQSLTRHGYKPQPLKRVFIPKANGTKRPLSIPAMKDRAMQALYLSALEPVSETIADRNSYGFRKERSTADAIERGFLTLARKCAPQWILEGDIKGCFDNIDHAWLVANIPMDKMMLSKWLKAGYLENQQLFPTESGVPQGGTISPTLANLALDGLEQRLADVFGRKRYIKAEQTQINLLVNYVRYADDFIITGRSEELLNNEVKPIVENFLRERGLSLSSEKTKITHIEKGFDFLGYNVRKYDNKLLIKPAKQNIKRFLIKIRGKIKENKALDQRNLIEMLNPMIKGWSDYHRHMQKCHNQSVLMLVINTQLLNI